MRPGKGLAVFRAVLIAARDLLQLDFGTCLYELLFEVFSLVLGQTFLNGLGSAVNDVFRLLKAKTGKFLHQLHNLKLIGTCSLEDYIEVGLLSSSSATAGSTTCSRTGNRYSGSRLNAIGFLEVRCEFVDFLNGQFYQLISESFYVSHFVVCLIS